MVEKCLEQGLPEPDFDESHGVITVMFYKDKFTKDNLTEMGFNERQIKAVMYVKEKGKITNKEYQRLNSISKPMATIELKELYKKRVFDRLGTTGKGTEYIIMHK
jgi:ATP-dependent DNA helicase RecG